jgi:hypothetical protein
MRKMVYVFFSILLVAAIIVMLGIIPLSFLNPLQQANHAKANGAIIVLNQPDEFQKIDFERGASAVQHLGVDIEDSAVKNVTETTHIQLIRGHSLDVTGNATSWMFIVAQPGKVSLATYDRRGQTVNAWQGDFPEKEIVISEILPPRDLFSKNRDQIFLNPEAITTESIDLALAENNYYLTITSAGKIRNLVFDAKTGVLTSSNDK